MFVSDLLTERKNKAVNFQVKNEQVVYFKSRVQYRGMLAGTIHNPALDRWLCGYWFLCTVVVLLIKVMT